MSPQKKYRNIRSAKSSYRKKNKFLIKNSKKQKKQRPHSAIGMSFTKEQKRFGKKKNPGVGVSPW